MVCHNEDRFPVLLFCKLHLNQPHNLMILLLTPAEHELECAFVVLLRLDQDHSRPMRNNTSRECVCADNHLAGGRQIFWQQGYAVCHVDLAVVVGGYLCHEHDLSLLAG
jgi:hypothetical protein